MATNYTNNVQKTHLNTWKMRLEMTDLFMIPKGYRAYKEKDTYLRFTSYMQESIARLMSGKFNQMPDDFTHGANLRMQNDFETGFN